MRYRTFPVATALVFAAVLSVVAQRPVLSDTLGRVYFLKSGESYSTGFTIDLQGEQFMIAAKHALPEGAQTRSVEVLHEGAWKTLDVEPIVPEGDADMVALKLPMKLTPVEYVVEPTSKGLALGQDVYFMGYPSGLHTDNTKGGNRGFPVPFVKNGIVSAFGKRVDGYSIIYIDGINNLGFSGGPVVFRDEATGYLKIAGVISGYRQEPNRVLNQSLDTGLTAVGNSGITIAHDIWAAREAIEKHQGKEQPKSE
jgi:S1-C subfamily serine protease